ncbi:hypothetical protein SDC9_101837 [bioreactor metagenome]|uniref:Uncharacterized protein n=1 Tax=bioreactor metagenome TaxID=1076179 RepID=A0A645AP72_9ZZZZ
MLRVDECTDTTLCLRLRHRMQGHRRLAGGLRPVDLDDPAPWQAPDAERDVQRHRPGRDHLDVGVRPVSQTHHRTLAVLLLDLAERGVQRLLAVVDCHRLALSSPRRRDTRPPPSGGFGCPALRAGTPLSSVLAITALRGAGFACGRLTCGRLACCWWCCV